MQRIHDVFEQAIAMPNPVRSLAKYDRQLMPTSPQPYARFAEDTFNREKTLVDQLESARPS